jgi:hypothetical protein
VNRILCALTAAVLSASIAGCGSSSRAGNGTPPSAVGRSSIEPLPPEYRVLADNLAIGIKTGPSEFQDNKELAQIISEGHVSVLAFRGIQSADSDITYIAAQGQAAASEIVSRLERVNSLPKPPSAGSLFVESFIHGLYGNFITPYAQGVDADEKQKAIIAEVQALMAAVDKADAAQMMLPTIAKKYAASPSSAASRIVADIDESWGGFGPHDWLSLYNSGPTLEDCTIEVVLTGATGQTRTNVHFVRNWPVNTWLYARYEPGQEILGKQAGKMTVTLIQKADITVWSPKFTTSIAYAYNGAEKDKDIAERCSKLAFTGRYQPFQKGIVWNTQRGCYFTMKGFPHIPKCRADVTFRKGPQSREWYWELDYWKEGEEKEFGTTDGQLAFDPDAIDLTFSFPDSAYKHKVTLTVNK